MNYQSIYDQLITKYINHPKVKFQTNNHHIIPKSFAEVDNIEDIDGRWNRVHLPHKAHFIAHLLLARIWRGHKIKGPKMATALNRMTECGTYTSKDYTWLKLNYSHGPHSNETKEKIRNARKTQVITDETRQKLSVAATGNVVWKGRKHKPESIEKIRNWNINKPSMGMLGKTHTQETKLKMSRPMTEEQKQKLRKPKSDSAKINIGNARRGKGSSLKGKTLSEEAKEKFRKPKSKSVCPYCNKEGGTNGLKRYHFDNCKNSPNRKNLQENEVSASSHSLPPTRRYLGMTSSIPSSSCTWRSCCSPTRPCSE